MRGGVEVASGLGTSLASSVDEVRQMCLKVLCLNQEYRAPSPFKDKEKEPQNRRPNVFEGGIMPIHLL